MSQPQYWYWDEKRKDHYHPQFNHTTSQYEYTWSRDLSAPRTVPAATSLAYTEQSPPSQPSPQPPPQPLDGYSRGVISPSSSTSQPRSSNYVFGPSRTDVDNLTRDFANLGTRSGHGTYSQALPRTTSTSQAPPRSSSVAYEPARSTTGRDQPDVYYDPKPRGYSTTQTSRPLASLVAASGGFAESSRAAGKRPAQGYAAMSNALDPNFTFGVEGRSSMPYGSPPSLTSTRQGSSTEAQTSSGSYNATSTQFGISNYRGRLDPNDFYVRRPPKDFYVEGKVFIKLHTEDASSETGDHSSFGFSTVAYEELAYSQLRRFVVVKVRSKENCCLCIPITTYSGRGAGKKGVDQRAHAIIYTGSHPPEKLPHEREMNKSAIRVVPYRADEKLDPKSRVNMGKIYTVEWNTKVKEIGQVEKNSLIRLIAYWRQIINT